MPARSQDFPMDRFVSLLREKATSGQRTVTIYNRLETLRHVRAVEDTGRCEVLCGRVWRSAYIEPFGLGKVFVGSGSRPRG